MPPTRAEALEAYRGLPVPDTTEEAWRFTDLKGFDPESFGGQNGHVRGQTPDMSERAMVELDTAGTALVTEDGIEIERAPDGIRFEPLSEDHPRLHELVGSDEKFAAHNAAVWKHGLLVEVPKGVVAREAALRPDRELGRERLALLPAARRRRARVAVLRHRGVRVGVARPPARTRTSPSSSSSSRPRSSSTSRSRTSRGRPGTSPRTTRASSATPSSTGSPAASARRRARSGSRTTSPARARPHA